MNKMILQAASIFSMALAFCGSSRQEEHFMLVGTYTSTGSYGIYVYKFNSNDGSIEAVDSVACADPSYLAVSANNKFVYAVSEVDGREGSVVAFSFDKQNGKLKRINDQPSGGIAPCYVATDNNGKIVTVGNYMSGTVAIFPVNDDGSLSQAAQIKKHEGNGPDSGRQESPHVHATVISPDEKFLFVPDLGIDKIMVYPLNKSNATLGDPTPVAVQSGSGPRHLVFNRSGKHAYVVQELKGLVTAFSYDGNGGLKSIQSVSILPAGYQGPAGSADIHLSPDENFLYATNRGESNTIAIFSVDHNSGKLTLVGHQSTLGRIPRNFSFDPSGDFLLAANQESGNIVVFKVDHKSGQLSPLPKQLQVPKPVCIKWIK